MHSHYKNVFLIITPLLILVTAIPTRLPTISKRCQKSLFPTIIQALNESDPTMNYANTCNTNGQTIVYQNLLDTTLTDRLYQVIGFQNIPTTATSCNLNIHFPPSYPILAIKGISPPLDIYTLPPLPTNLLTPLSSNTYPLNWNLPSLLTTSPILLGTTLILPGMSSLVNSQPFDCSGTAVNGIGYKRQVASGNGTGGGMMSFMVQVSKQVQQEAGVNYNWGGMNGTDGGGDGEGYNTYSDPTKRQFGGFPAGFDAESLEGLSQYTGGSGLSAAGLGQYGSAGGLSSYGGGNGAASALSQYESGNGLSNGGAASALSQYEGSNAGGANGPQYGSATGQNIPGTGTTGTTQGISGTDSGSGNNANYAAMMQALNSSGYSVPPQYQSGSGVNGANMGAANVGSMAGSGVGGVGGIGAQSAGIPSGVGYTRRQYGAEPDLSSGQNSVGVAGASGASGIANVGVAGSLSSGEGGILPGFFLTYDC